MSIFRKSHAKKILSFIFALTLIVTAFTGCGEQKTETNTTDEAEPVITTEPPVVYRNPLTGEAGYNKELLGNRPVAIIIENHAKSRPQWGLTSPDIIFETVAEGGVTRMVFLYADIERIPDKVGPVRSTRHYFLDIAESFDALFIHYGQSPLAKTQLTEHKIDNVNGITGDSKYFARDTERNVSADHTAYTTKENIIKAIKDKEYRTTINEDYATPFNFHIDGNETLSGGSCVNPTITFSGATSYTFNYDKQENVYYASINGSEFMDSNGTQQNFENIIILYTDITAIKGDSKNRVDLDFSEGNGVYISNGSFCNITWEKGESKDMLKLYDDEEAELKLNVGRTYVAICDNSCEEDNIIE